MPRFITPETLFSVLSSVVTIDVRKEPAKAASGMTITSAILRDPYMVATWCRSLAGKRAVVFCVHGHEVSQSVCSHLADQGVDASYLQGGFEAWSAEGYPVEPIR